MQHPKTDIGSLGPWWGRDEQTESTIVPLMTRTGVFHNSGIPAFKDNLVSYVKAGGNGNMSSALSVWEP